MCEIARDMAHAETSVLLKLGFAHDPSNYQAPIFAEIAYCNVQSDKKESMKSAVSEIAHVANHLNDELNRAYAQLNSFKT